MRESNWPICSFQIVTDGGRGGSKGEYSWFESLPNLTLEVVMNCDKSFYNVV